MTVVKMIVAVIELLDVLWVILTSLEIQSHFLVFISLKGVGDDPSFPGKETDGSELPKSWSLDVIPSHFAPETVFGQRTSELHASWPFGEFAVVLSSVSDLAGLCRSSSVLFEVPGGVGWRRALSFHEKLTFFGRK